MRTPSYLVSMLCLIPAALYAQAPPDFSGVYYPINPFGVAALGRGAPPADAKGKQKGPPPRPTQSAPLSDGSQGRSPDAPSADSVAKVESASELRQRSRCDGEARERTP